MRQLIHPRSIAACAAILVASTAFAAQVAYKQTNLVSDGSASAATTDANLKNPWGVASGAGTYFWVANQVTATASTYDGSGNPFGTVVNVPSGTGDVGPTGVAFNGTTDFNLSATGDPAQFIFANLNGKISGFNPAVNATSTVDKVDNSATAIYTGLAIGNNGSGNFVYAANAKAGTVDVFNGTFAPATLAGNFTDPNLPAGLAPFNVANVGGKLYVTYAAPEGAPPAAVDGVVNVFDTNGNFVKRFATAGALDEPWGVVKAPANFGAFSNALLIGNDGNGHLNAYDEATGNFLGEFVDADGKPIVNEELWGLAFGDDSLAGKSNVLYFAAGINDEAGGLFGSIEPTTPNGNAIPLPAAALLAPPVFAFAVFMRKRV